MDSTEADIGTQKERDAERHAIETRPKSFDDRVLSYLPALKALAARMEKMPHNRQDLINDTIVSALQRWQSFREDGAMFSWLKFTMRGIQSNRAKMRAGRLAKSILMGVKTFSEPNQEHYADLSIAFDKLSGVKHGDVLLKSAVGNTDISIAHELGMSKQNVNKRILAARANLVNANA